MISIRNYTKYFHRGSINEVLALDNINLEVRSGDFITIIGSNGAGKSTLLNCLAGTHGSDTGTIELNGTDITLWPEYRRASFIGRVFQDPLLGTCGALSIEQNMALAARRGARRGFKIGVRSGLRNQFKKELTCLGLGLENRLQDKVGLLSGGQRQALTMIMATMVRPDVLLLDEHTAALDPKTGQQILDLTRKIVDERQLTTLMVTHNMNHALALGNRLIMLHRGRIIMDIDQAEKQHMKKQDLLERFYTLKGEEFSSDRVLLS